MRWYDQSLGRFIQPDTLVPDPGDPVAFDRYHYSRNSPLVFADPDGHWACEPKFCGYSHDYDEEKDAPDWLVTVAELYYQSKKQLTLTEKILSGDLSALPELLIPSHIGLRIQFEISVDLGIGLPGSFGANAVYNRISNEAAANVDWAFEPGVGLGGGISLIGGPIIGWGSSDVDDVTKGYSLILSGTAAAQEALAFGITAPIDPNQGLYVDPYSGQIPVTVFMGGGAGGGYAGLGVGVNGPTRYYIDLTNLFSWFSR
jgi:hypothetical protein